MSKRAVALIVVLCSLLAVIAIGGPIYKRKIR